METRRAVFHVLLGAFVGALAPVAAAWALSSVVPGFHLRSHIFTLFLLSIGGALIGMFVNLPSSTDDGRPANGSRGGGGSRATGFGPPGGRRDAGGQRAHGAGAAGDAASNGGANGAGAGAGAGHVRDMPRVDPIDQTGPLSRRSALNVLGLEANPTGDEIRAAYRKLARQHHPDQHTQEGAEAIERATHRFRRVKQAYDILARDEELGI